MRTETGYRDRRFSPESGDMPDTIGRLWALAGQGLDRWVDSISACPWTAYAGSGASHRRAFEPAARQTRQPLYTPEQRQRRDETA